MGWKAEMVEKLTLLLFALTMGALLYGVVKSSPGFEALRNVSTNLGSGFSISQDQ